MLFEIPHVLQVWLQQGTWLWLAAPVWLWLVVVLMLSFRLLRFVLAFVRGAP